MWILRIRNKIAMKGVIEMKFRVKTKGWTIQRVVFKITDFEKRK